MRVGQTLAGLMNATLVSMISIFFQMFLDMFLFRAMRM